MLVVKMPICVHSWRAAFIAFSARGACKGASIRNNGSGPGGT